jgi:tellurium resistance protein TerD
MFSYTGIKNWDMYAGWFRNSESDLGQAAAVGSGSGNIAGNASGSDANRDADMIIFYNQLKSACGSVQHTGDNLTGAGEGDDEVIMVDLTRVPADVQKIAFTVTIHEAEQRRQNFGQVGNAYIRVVNADTNSEVTRYDLAEDASTETAMIFGELYRHSGEWRFTAVGQGYAGGLAAMCRQYGINI